MKNYNELEKLLKNGNLTREQKVQAINKYFDDYRASIDKELNNYILKQQVGAALEIGSAAIPMGGASNIGRTLGAKALEKTVGKALTKDIANKGIGAALGNNILQKYFGNKISEEIGSGAFAGLNSGAMFGVGRGLIEGKNPFKSAIEDASLGFLSGGIGGAVLGNAERYLRGKQLKNFGDIDTIGNNSRNQYFEKAKNFYKNYNQGIKLNDIDFSRRGLKETLKWNPKQAQNFPDLINDIKKAEKLSDAPNLKTEQKPDVSRYELYQGKNGLHHIEVSNRGEKRYYITKDTPVGGSLTTSQGANKSINNMINDFDTNFNPAQVAIPGIIPAGMPQINSTDQQPYQLRIEKTIWDTIPMADPIKNKSHIFTPAEIGKMSNEEFSQHETAIMNQAKNGLIKPQTKRQNYAGYRNAVNESNQIFSREDIGAMSAEEFDNNQKAIWSQLNSIGIPTNNELQQSSSNGGGTIYVKPYRRSDGTEVKGYYRSL